MANPAYIDSDGVLTVTESWVPLASSTVAGADVASITFTSPEDGSSLDWAQFMDLVLIGYHRVTGAEVIRYINILLNADSTAGNYVVEASGAATSLTLPAITASIWTTTSSQEFTVMDGAGNAGTYPITVTVNAANPASYIQGSSSYTLNTNWQSVTFFIDADQQWQLK